jgi:hypothetical protein
MQMLNSGRYCNCALHRRGMDIAVVRVRPRRCEDETKSMILCHIARGVEGDGVTRVTRNRVRSVTHVDPHDYGSGFDRYRCRLKDVVTWGVLDHLHDGSPEGYRGRKRGRRSCGCCCRSSGRSRSSGGSATPTTGN